MVRSGIAARVAAVCGRRRCRDFAVRAWSCSSDFLQLVIDKVLVHESFTTLYVLAGGATGALIFEAIFNFLRRYLLLYATNKVDIG